MLHSSPALGNDAAVPLEAGEPAPFDGQLLPTELAITIGGKAADCDAYAAADLKLATETAALKIAHQKDLTKGQRERGDEFKALAEKEAEKADSVWRSSLLVSAASVAATLAMVAITGWALGQVGDRQ